MMELILVWCNTIDLVTSGGVTESQLWLGVPGASSSFQFFAGQTQVCTVSGSRALYLNSQTTTTTYQDFSIFAQNLAAGNSLAFDMGVSGNDYFQLLYNYTAKASSANNISLGFSGVRNVLNLTQAGKVSSYSGSTLDDSKGTMTLVGGLLVDGVASATPSSSCLYMYQSGGAGYIQAYNGPYAQGTLTLNGGGGTIMAGGQISANAGIQVTNAGSTLHTFNTTGVYLYNSSSSTTESSERVDITC